MLALALLGCSHLPSYGCEERCCRAPHHHTESQVFYGRGKWGLELDRSEFKEGEILDIDAVFRDPVDPKKFELYIGCGGCATNDPILAPRVQIVYSTGVLEPFTHTRYYSVFQQASQRKYNTSLLANCVSNHFTIRMVTNESIVWAPVIGISELETLAPLSLLRFPVFVLQNHGAAWNDQGWTFFVISMCIAPLVVFSSFSLLSFFYALQIPKTAVKICYLIAILGFTSSLLENLHHTAMAQSGIPVGGQLFIAVFINVLSNGLGISYCVAAWRNSRSSKDGYKAASSDNVSIDDRWRAGVDFAVSVFFLFFFGAGFYLGSAGIFFAAVFRVL